jgi:hypothetical protein
MNPSYNELKMAGPEMFFKTEFDCCLIYYHLLYLIWIYIYNIYILIIILPDICDPRHPGWPRQNGALVVGAVGVDDFESVWNETNAEILLEMYSVRSLIRIIVIMKVSYGLVLSLLLSVILSLSKVKQSQKINGQDHLAT